MPYPAIVKRYISSQEIIENICGNFLSSPVENLVEAHDKKLYSDLLNDLQPDGAIIRFLRYEDVGNSIIYTKYLYSIYDFVDKWNNPQYEFIDPYLEDKRKLFLDPLIKLKFELSSNTWLCLHDPTFSSMEAPEYDLGHPRWQKVDEINALATEIYDLYVDLIRSLKRKLGLPID